MSCIMPWRSSFPCHRMCCGPDNILWFALSVFRVADMIGIVGHVSILPHKKRNKKIADTGITFRAAGSATIRSAQTKTPQPAHSAQPSYSASTGASHAGQAFDSASWAGRMSPSRFWCPCSPTLVYRPYAIADGQRTVRSTQCVAGGLEFGAGSILGSVRCGGTGLPQASGLFVSLPFRRAIARLVPSVCETLPPREGGLHARLTDCIIAHAMEKQLPLS